MNNDLDSGNSSRFYTNFSMHFLGQSLYGGKAIVPMTTTRENTDVLKIYVIAHKNHDIIIEKEFAATFYPRCTMLTKQMTTQRLHTSSKIIPLAQTGREPLVTSSWLHPHL